ncbi:hypothetical protein BH24ACT26_BH24ACT26_16430 [soil metagenome]
MPIRLKLPSGEPLAERALWAHGFAQRAKGLIAHAPLEPGEALVIDGGSQVHTFGMRYEIDVLFCDKHWVVLHVLRRMPPRRVSRWVRRTRYIVELTGGAAPDEVAPGVQLALDHSSFDKRP